MTYFGHSSNHLPAWLTSVQRASYAFDDCYVVLWVRPRSVHQLRFVERIQSNTDAKISTNIAGDTLIAGAQDVGLDATTGPFTSLLIIPCTTNLCYMSKGRRQKFCYCQPQASTIRQGKCMLDQTEKCKGYSG